MSFNILLANQTQSFHKEKMFIASEWRQLQLPGWVCVISFYRLLSGNNLPRDVVTDQSELSIPQSRVITMYNICIMVF